MARTSRQRRCPKAVAHRHAGGWPVPLATELPAAIATRLDVSSAAAAVVGARERGAGDVYQTPSVAHETLGVDCCRETRRKLVIEMEMSLKRGKTLVARPTIEETTPLMMSGFWDQKGARDEHARARTAAFSALES
jgi:hypothetical protein